KVLQTLGNEGDTAKVHQTLVVLEVDGAGADVGQPHAPPTAQSAPPLPPQQAGSPAPLSTAPGPARVEQASRPQPRAQPPQPRPSGGEERIPLRGLRKRIAESMVKSKSTAPHFTFVEETDTRALTSLRARLNERLAARGEAKLSYLPFIAKALVAAFRKFPHLNAVMD